MIEYRRILSDQDPSWQQVWDLYNFSFPQEERRGLDYQLSTLGGQGDYHCEAVFDTVKGCFVGFVMWWEFVGFRYIEHFAVDSSLRGGGYGARIVADFLGRSDVPVLLEVEYPDSAINARRIGFYERCGFVLNPHSYSHPPYWSDSVQWVELLVMTSGGAISQAELEAFKSEAFPVVHFEYF